MKKNIDKSLLKWMTWTGILFFAIILFLQHDNIFRWIEATSTVQKQKQTIRNLEKEIAEMDDFLQKVNNDPAVLEQYARETFYFCEPGEDVYIDRTQK